MVVLLAALATQKEFEKIPERSLNDHLRLGGFHAALATAHSDLKGMFELDEKKGIQGFIAKPFIADEIVDKVKKALNTPPHPPPSPQTGRG